MSIIESELRVALKKSIQCKPNEYKIIFHSKSILFASALSDYIFQQLKIQKTTSLLIDFYEEQIDELFNQIVCKRSIQLLKNIPQTKFELKRLNEVIKQKRIQFYKAPGIFSLSSEILIKDLLRLEKIIDPNLINRIVIRISQKITSYFNYFGWIFTILKKQTKNCSVLIICREVQYYTDFQHLQGIYRTFFCQKLVIWPFGRSEIHKSISKSNSKINQLKHYIDMTEEMKRNQQILKSLLQLVQQQYNRFRSRKVNGMQILFKESVHQQFSEQQAELYELKDFRNIKYLMNSIQNCDFLHLTGCVLSLRTSNSEKSIWSSKSATVSDLLSQLETTSKFKVFNISRVEEDQKKQCIDLTELIINYHSDRQQHQLAQSLDDWQANFELEYKISLNATKNHKIYQLYQIVDKIIDQIQAKRQKTQNNKRQRCYKMSQDSLNLFDQQQQFSSETLLINCPSQTAKKYVHRQLFNKVNDCHYIDYLRFIYHFLSFERQLRIANIKSIFSKMKTKKVIEKMEVQQNKADIEKKQQFGEKVNEYNQLSNAIPNTNSKRQLNQQSLVKSLSSSQIIQDILSQGQENFQFQIKGNNAGKGKKQQNQSNQQILNIFDSFYNEEYKQRQQRQKNINQTKNQDSQLKNQRNSGRQQSTLFDSIFTKKIKNKKSSKQVYNQNCYVLEQVLYKQLTILFQILSRYQNQIFTQQEIRTNQSTRKKDKNITRNSQQQNHSKIIKINKIQQRKSETIHERNYKTLGGSGQKQNKKNNSSIQNLLKQQFQVFQKLFQHQLNRNKFSYIQTDKLKIVPIYSQQSEICFYQKNRQQRKILIVNVYAPKLTTSDKVTQFNQSIQLINPQRCLFYSPHTWQIRNLYLTHSMQLLSRLKEIHILSFKNSFQVACAEYQVKQQEQAFWKISQNRLKLSQYKQNPDNRIQELQMNDKYQKTVDFLSYALKNDPKVQQKPHIYNLSLNMRRIIVDSRQFKSALPCHLFFYGFTVIPIQLETADYILSEDVGIEKKSVQTKDLHQSLKSFRLDKQIKRMCQQFKKPYLLIECQESQDFKKQSFFQRSISTQGSKQTYRVYIRQRLAQIMKKFPKLRIIWSDSVKRTCEIFKQLKRDRTQPQIGKYLKHDKDDKIQKNKNKQDMFDSEQDSQEEIKNIKMQIQD